MCVYLRTKFQVSSIILTSFRQGGNFTPKKRAPKKRTQIRVKIPGANLKHLRNSSSKLRVGYIVAERTHVSPRNRQTQNIQKRLEKLVMAYVSNPFFSYLKFNKLNTNSKWFFIFTNEKNTYFCTRYPLRNSHIICIPKAPCSNEVNFDICPHTKTKWKTRCKFAKIPLRMGYLGHCYCVIQNFKNLMAWTFYSRKKIGT